jgi:hypothetical protein
MAQSAERGRSIATAARIQLWPWVRTPGERYGPKNLGTLNSGTRPSTHRILRNQRGKYCAALSHHRIPRLAVSVGVVWEISRPPWSNPSLPNAAVDQVISRKPSLQRRGWSLSDRKHDNPEYSIPCVGAAVLSVLTGSTMGFGNHKSQDITSGKRTNSELAKV